MVQTCNPMERTLFLSNKRLTIVELHSSRGNIAQIRYDQTASEVMPSSNIVPIDPRRRRQLRTSSAGCHKTLASLFKRVREHQNNDRWLASHLQKRRRPRNERRLRLAGLTSSASSRSRITAVINQVGIQYKEEGEAVEEVHERRPYRSGDNTAIGLYGAGGLRLVGSRVPPPASSVAR